VGESGSNGGANAVQMSGLTDAQKATLLQAVQKAAPAK